MRNYNALSLYLVSAFFAIDCLLIQGVLADPFPQRLEEQFDQSQDKELTEILPNELWDHILSFRDPEIEFIVSKDLLAISESDHRKKSLIQSRLSEQNALLDELNRLIDQVLSCRPPYGNDNIAQVEEILKILKKLDENKRIRGVIQSEVQTALMKWLNEQVGIDKDLNKPLLRPNRLTDAFVHFINRVSKIRGDVRKLLIENWQTLSGFDVQSHSMFQLGVLLHDEEEGSKELGRFLDVLDAHRRQVKMDLAQGNWRKAFKPTWNITGGLVGMTLRKVISSLNRCFEATSEGSEARRECENFKERFEQYQKDDLHNAIEKIRRFYGESIANRPLGAIVWEGNTIKHLDFVPVEPLIQNLIRAIEQVGEFPKRHQAEISIFSTIANGLPKNHPAKADLLSRVERSRDARLAKLFGKVSEIRAFPSNYSKQRAITLLISYLVNDIDLLSYGSPLKHLLNDDLLKDRHLRGAVLYQLKNFIQEKQENLTAENESGVQQITKDVRDALTPEEFENWTQESVQQQQLNAENRMQDTDVEMTQAAQGITVLEKRKRPDLIPVQVESLNQAQPRANPDLKRKLKKRRQN